MTRLADYIIVGQGLAGSVLAVELLRRGRRIQVFDEPSSNRSSVISAGICNPITGKIMASTYAADLLFPFLQRWYPEAEKMLGGRFFHSIPVYRPFLSRLEQKQWLVKAEGSDLSVFIQKIHQGPTAGESLHDPFGGLELGLSGYLEVKEWVASVRDMLMSMDMYRQQYVDERELIVGEDIVYQDVRAARIIFCNGLFAKQSSWFGYLPLRPLKGETLVVRMPMPPGQIISRGVYMVPTRTAGEFVVGSTYQHEPFVAGITPEARTLLLDRLAALARVAAVPIHQDWGIRPTVTDRRPLMGSHPRAKNVYIFNGLGTKGVSLAPYFASRLTDWMEGVGILPEEVNISRFKPLYSN